MARGLIFTFGTSFASFLFGISVAPYFTSPQPDLKPRESVVPATRASECPTCEQNCPTCPTCEADDSKPPSDCPSCPACEECPTGNSQESSGAYDRRQFYPLHHQFNRFERWYDKHTEGKGVWKWDQYFPAWERHLAKFVKKSWSGQEVHMAELGIFSGGSLEMWQAIFGPGLRLWGLDLAMATKQYEKDDKSGRTKIFNMDQTDPKAWAKFRELVPHLDILIDDGCHIQHCQKATFDQIMKHIAPGGVFLSEDISDKDKPGDHPTKSTNLTASFLTHVDTSLRRIHYRGSREQDTIDSVHYYPYLLVVEKREVPLHKARPLAAIKHGTIWKPISHGVVKGAHAHDQ